MSVCAFPCVRVSVFVREGVKKSIIYFAVYSFVGKRYFIYPVFQKVNALTFKLKTHLGKVGGQTSVVEEERRRKQREGNSVEKASNPC